jgi:microcystin-dependent protein
MAIDIRVHIELTERQKRVMRAGIVGGTVIASLGIGVAIAMPIDTSWITSGAPVSASSLASNLNGLQSQVTALVPAGTIMAYGGIIDGNPNDTIDGGAPKHPPPSGWLLCNGDQLNGLDATYANLYAAIGINFGGNTNSQAFNLPDLRGRFLRGTNNGSGVDPDSASRTPDHAGGNTGDQVGSTQSDAFASHTHAYNSSDQATPDQVGSGGVYYNMNANGYGAKTSGATGGSETRPVNSYVNFIIKY